MSNFFDDSSFGDFPPLEEIGLFRDDENNAFNNLNNGLFFTPAIPEVEKDIKGPYPTLFSPLSLNFEDQATNYETKKKDNFLSLNNIYLDNSNIKVPQLYACEDIIKILEGKNSKKILENFTKDEKIVKYEKDMHFLNQKRKRNRSKIKEKEIIYSRGRKKKDDRTNRKHCKYASDNIMKKIKSKLIDNAISFINKIVNRYNSNEEPKKDLFKKIDYKYINQMKQELDAELLNSPLKNLILKDVSPKFSNVSPDSNRIKFEELMKNKKDDKALMFALDLPFRDFIDLFCSKKTLNDVESSRKLERNIFQKIMNELPGIDSLLNEISENNDKMYLSHFIFHLFNYENFILMKKGRKSSK